eukprot:6203731-Pleurochrysis_carterae.AAC.1
MRYKAARSEYRKRCGVCDSESELFTIRRVAGTDGPTYRRRATPAQRTHNRHAFERPGSRCVRLQSVFQTRAWDLPRWVDFFVDRMR